MSNSAGYVPVDAEELFSYYQCLKCGHKLVEDEWLQGGGRKSGPVVCKCGGTNISKSTIYGREDAPPVYVEAESIARFVCSEDQLALILADGGQRRFWGILKDLGFDMDRDHSINKDIDEENDQIEYWQVLED